MEHIFISDLTINKVRHLQGINIPLSKENKKHLIVTGKNGSGKTSLLDAIAGFLNTITTSQKIISISGRYRDVDLKNSVYQLKDIVPEYEILDIKLNSELYKKDVENITHEIMLEINYPFRYMRSTFEQGNFIVAYYKAERIFQAITPAHVEKVELKNNYKITENPREQFVKYLLDLKMTEALATIHGNSEKAFRIKTWYEKLQNLLKEIFEDDSLTLEFDVDTFKFSIHMNGREPFDFNTLSSGYAAVLDIVVDLIIRMEKQTQKPFDFTIPGIVLIDEIETHLHLELQKRILKLLATIFPNIQFIVSTHSPFILNSLEDVVIYDLENRVLVKEGLADIPYDGIVEGYFNVNTLSALLKQNYERYKHLVKKAELSDEDFEEIARLEMYLNEIPDYLALNITTEYQRLKQEFESREDL